MQSMTKLCGIIFFACAITVIVLSITDTAPEATDAAKNLRRGGPTSDPAPIATSVKYKIGGEPVFDLMVLGALVLFGYFLYTSEIQQTWAVVVTALLVVGSIVIRTTPLLPMDVGNKSAGCAFWGAYVIDDFYHPPQRRVRTFPMNRNYRFSMLERTTSTTANPAQSVVLDFGNAPELGARFDSMPGGAQLIGKLAGTRTILDEDNKRVVYSVPHLMVEKIVQLGSGRG